MSKAPLLTVRNLRVIYPGDEGDVRGRAQRLVRVGT